MPRWMHRAYYKRTRPTAIVPHNGMMIVPVDYIQGLEQTLARCNTEVATLRAEFNNFKMPGACVASGDASPSIADTVSGATTPRATSEQLPLINLGSQSSWPTYQGVPPLGEPATYQGSENDLGCPASGFYGTIFRNYDMSSARGKRQGSETWNPVRDHGDARSHTLPLQERENGGEVIDILKTGLWSRV